MSRWEPDARGRLERAAYELFLDRGYDRTTVADIAQHAGLTERTFFRHYSDKREVLFGGASGLQDALSRALDGVAREISPMEAARVAIEAISALMHGRLSLARERQRIIATHADLGERDLNKRATLTAALEAGLRRRGVAASTADLAAEMGIAVFYSAFARWLGAGEGRELIDVVRERFEELKMLAAETS